MLGRLGLAGRLAAILLLALLAVTALWAGLAYVGQHRRTGDMQEVRLPERIAAIVDLVAAGSSPRSTLLAAVNSENLEVRLQPGPASLPPGSERLAGIEWLIGQSLESGQARSIVAAMAPEESPRWRQLRIAGLWLASPSPLTIDITLAGGEHLLVRTRGDIAPRLLGLPPGFWIGFLGALVGLAALVAILREARPLRELAGSLARFAESAVPVPVEPRGAPEIRSLIVSVNGMQQRIATLLTARTVLLGGISHDLKTYITRLRLRVEDLPAETERDKAVRDLDDMTAMLEDALAVARGGAGPMHRRPLDLVELVAAEVAEREKSRVRLAARPAEACVHGDRTALRRLLANLLDNALHHAGRAEVRIEAGAGRIDLHVDDDGPGIPPGQRALVLEPFVRLEASRNRATGGSGLGLAIARAIAEAHGGSLAVADAPLGGARLTVSLPAPAAPA